MPGKLRIGALVSGGGTNLQAIIDACEDNRIDGDLVFVGADNPDAGGLDRARSRGIPTFFLSYKQVISDFKKDPGDRCLPDDIDFDALWARQRLISGDRPDAGAELFIKSRVVAEAGLLKKMARYPFDLLVLAGFMRVLTPYFIGRVNSDSPLPRIMNIHPALLPAFPGTDGYGDTFRYGCKVAGCTVHFVDYGEDTGPIIGQRAFPIMPHDTLDSVRQKGLKLEWELYPACIQLYAEGRLKLSQASLAGARKGTGQRTIVEVLPLNSG